MKKKGFTLIELLAVVVILAIIAVIIVPVISDLIESSRFASAVDSVLAYVTEANNQASVSDNIVIGGFEGFSLDLSNNNRLETGITDTELAKISYKGKGPSYVYLHFDDAGKYVNDGRFCMWGYSIDYRSDKGASRSESEYCGPHALVKEHYDLGDPIYYNVTTGKQCSEDAFLNNVYELGSHSNFAYVGGKLVSRSLEAIPIGLHSGCMKFYVIKDENNEVTMIAANNIDEIGPDKTETDSSKFGVRYTYWADVKDGASVQNVKDFNNITNPLPNSHYVMDTLKNYTKDWKVSTVAEDYNYTYTYTDNETEVTDSYTIPYHTDGYKARLITKAELDNIYSEANDTLWLSDYLTLYKTPYIAITGMESSTLYEGGYWTSDAMDASHVYIHGIYNYTNADGSWTTYRCGVRPVITLSKDSMTGQEIYYAAPEITNTENVYAKYDTGSVFYYNVTTGKECTKAEADNNLSYRHTPVGVKSGCMKFYSLSDSEYSDTVSLILDHPITYDGVYWNDAYSYTNDWGEETVYNRSIFFEPTTLLDQIKTDIAGWQGLEEIDNYTTDAVQYNASCSTCSNFHYRLTIPYKDYGVKARIMTAKDMDDVVRDTKYPQEYSDGTYGWGNTTRSSFAKVNGTSHLGSTAYCSYSTNYGDSGYNPNCNPYGTVGYPILKDSWLFKDYARWSVTNSPSPEHLDWYDMMYTSGDTGYEGCYWTSDIAYTDSGYDYGMLFMCDQAHWEITSTPHMYRPIVEIKKDKFTNVTQKDTIEMIVDDNYNYQTTLSNPTYSIMDTSVATVNSSGKITAKKVGVTQITVTSGNNIEYAKVVVKHKPYTYLATKSYGTYVYYDPVADRACNTSESRCENSNCKQYYVMGEDSDGNYLLFTNAENASSVEKGWQARWAIDDNPNAETRYGEMAYNHWWKTLEFMADFSKDFKTEIWEDYVDYTTEEYVIPWSKPAYYENGNPIYARARMLSVEDVKKMFRVISDGYPPTNLYEPLYNTGSSTVIGYIPSVSGGPLNDDQSWAYMYTIWNWQSHYNYETHQYDYDVTSNVSFNYYVIKVKKSKVGTIYTTDNPIEDVLRSTSDRIQTVGSSYYNYVGQTSTDGGLVDVRDEQTCTTYSSGSTYCDWDWYIYGVQNGHVKVSFVNGSYTYERDIVVDLEASCGQTDMCGRVTAACSTNEGNTSGGTDTTPGTIASSTVASGTDTTAPTCVLEDVVQLPNGIQPVLTCSDASANITIRSQWNVNPVGANQFTDIGIVKNGTSQYSNGVYNKTVRPQWTTGDSISVPHPNDCYYFRYGAMDGAGNWSFYISDKCYYGFSYANANRKTN